MSNFWLNRCRHVKNYGYCQCTTTITLCKSCGNCSDCGGQIVPKYSLYAACGSIAYALNCGSLLVSGYVSGQLSNMPKDFLKSGNVCSGQMAVDIPGSVCSGGYLSGDDLISSDPSDLGGNYECICNSR